MLSLVRPRRLQQRGDTIVEVLIAVAVISLVLVVSYAITNRNTLDEQDTHEHAQAVQLAQQQIEYLRVYTPQPFNTGTYQCFSSTGVPVPNGSPAACHPNGGTQPDFNIVVKPAGTNTYDVNVTWPGLNNDNNSVDLYYRPPQ